MELQFAEGHHGRTGTRMLRILIACAISALFAWMVPATAFANESNEWDGAIDTNWYSTSESTFSLSTAEQLAGLAAIVNGTAEGIGRDDFTGKTVTLEADIVLNETAATEVDSAQRNWTPIGGTPLDGFSNGMPNYDENIYFNGTFDGNGHAVKNIYIYSVVSTDEVQNYGGYQGLFGSLGGNAVVRNTGVDGGYIYGCVAGGIAAVSHASQENAPQIIGCYNTATIAGNTSDTGDGSTTYGTGGIFGGAEQYSGENSYRAAAVIANCYNTGTVSSESDAPVGGIAGTGSVRIYSSYNAGTVGSTSPYAGALAGNLVGAGAKVGDGNGVYEGSATVQNSYALEGVIQADSNDIVKLYNMLDATHTKGGADDANPAVTNADAAKFRSESWFASSYMTNALSNSFVHSGGEVLPKLYWQTGAETTDIAKYEYGTHTYEVEYIGNQAYTGSPALAQVRVTYTEWDWSGYPTLDLREGGDFLVSYENNVDYGTATATVTGIGRFYGSQSATFSIVNGDLSTAAIEPISAQWFYGTAVTPEITVRASTGERIPSYEYDVAFTDNDKAGTATVTVTAKEGSAFSGSTSIEFTLVEASSSLEGSGTEEDPYQLSSKGDIQFLATQTEKASSPYATAYYKVTNDIDASSADPDFMTDLSANPLGLGNGSFTGTIDGDGHTITLYLRDNGVNAGRWSYSDYFSFISKTAGSGTLTIKNLTLDGSIESPGNAAGFVGDAKTDTVFENCINKMSVKGGSYGYGGAGFVNYARGPLTFTDCINQGEIGSREGYAAGFVVTLLDDATFTNCSNLGKVESGDRMNVGGFIASLYNSTSSNIENMKVSFEGCSNQGDVITPGDGSAGGFIGWNIANIVDGIVFSKCVNTGNISGVTNAGGFVGQLRSAMEFTNCYNTGDVTVSIGNRGSWSGARPVAGFVGEWSSSSAVAVKFSNTYNIGKVYRPADATDSALKPTAAYVGSMNDHYICTVSFDNAYYEDTSAEVGFNISSDVSRISGAPAGQGADAMKTSAFVSMLGSAFSKDDEGVNDDYPVLKDRAVSDITQCTISDIATQTYKGTLPKPAVTVYNRSVRLAEGIDYVVFYKHEGTQGSATIRGIGSWAGEVVKTYQVDLCQISSCKVSPFKTMAYEYGKTPYTQDITVTSPAGTTLVEGTDYTVTYAGNEGAGTAHVLIEGKGNYTGETTRLFVIEHGDLTAGTLSGVAESYAYSYYGPRIQWEVTDAEGNVLRSGYGTGDYTVFYRDSTGRESMSTYGLTPGNCTVIVRGTNNWEGELTADFFYGTHVDTATVGGVESYYEYTGEPISIEPVLQVTNSNGYSYDIPSQCYDVKITDAAGEEVTEVVDLGTYTVSFTGNLSVSGYQGGWYGTRTVDFSVAKPIDDSAAIEGFEKPFVLSPGEKIPSRFTSVTVDGASLTEGVDYTVSYLDSDGDTVKEIAKAGSYVAVITGKGAFHGEVRVPFTVEEAPRTDLSVASVSVKNQTYTGSALKPAVTVKYGNATLRVGVDYSVSYSDNTNAGTAKVTVTGKGSYSGTKSANFTIAKASQNLKVSKAKKSVKAKKVVKKKQKTSKVKVTGVKTKVSYKKVAGSKKLVINKKTGKITVKKGTKKGTCKIKVKVSASAASNYKAASRTVTVKVVVK